MVSWSPINAAWFSPPDGEPGPVEDVALLEKAESEVRGSDAMSANARDAARWITAMQPARVGGYLLNPGANAFMITGGLDAANIPYVWQPYPPELMPMFRPGSGAVDRPFWLLVAPADSDDASALLAELGITASGWSSFSAPVTPDRSEEAEHYRLMRFFWVMVLVYGAQLLWMLIALFAGATLVMRALLRHVR